MSEICPTLKCCNVFAIGPILKILDVPERSGSLLSNCRSSGSFPRPGTARTVLRRPGDHSGCAHERVCGGVQIQQFSRVFDGFWSQNRSEISSLAGGIPRTVGFRVFPGPGRLETRPGHLGARWGALPGAVEVGSVLGRFFGISSRKNGLVHPPKPTLERSPGFSPGPRATESTFRHRAATLERCAARPVVGSRHHSEPLTRL